MKTIAFVLFAVLALGADPEFNKDGELVRPKNYREWIFLSSGVGMSYGAGNDPFTNVFVEPSAYRKFVETGKWPEKSIFALELRKPATEGSTIRVASIRLISSPSSSQLRILRVFQMAGDISDLTVPGLRPR